MTKAKKLYYLSGAGSKGSRVSNIQPEVNNNYDKKLISHKDFGGHSWYTNRSFPWRILIAGLFSVILTVTTAPRQETWLIRPFLCNPLYFLHKTR